MIAAIIAAEVAFWVCLLAGLGLRYTLMQPKLGFILFAATPLIDLGLLAYTFWDLSQTNQAGFFHAFGAFYVVFSVFFGKDTIQAMDRKWRGESEFVGEGFNRSIRDNLVRAVIATAITIAILAAMIGVTGFSGSFWLIYWIIAMAFLPVGWWAVDKGLERRKS